MFYELDICGGKTWDRLAFDVRTKTGAYCGIICDQPDGSVRLYYNGDATRGSKRKFKTRNDALEFMHARREKRAAARAAAK